LKGFISSGKKEYYLDGRKVKKELHLKLSEALTLADEEYKRKLEKLPKSLFGG